MFRALATIWLLALVQVTFAGFPLQPPLFQTRSVSPFLAYSFRQFECKDLEFPAAVGNLTLSRSLSSSNCPARTIAANIFNNALIGVSITNTSDRHAVKTPAISSAFDLATVDPVTGTRSLSIEIWFSLSFAPEIDVEHTLVEIGADTPGTDGISESQLRVRYKQASTDGDSAINFLFNCRDPSSIIDSTGGLPLSASLDFGIALASVRTSPLGTIFLLVVSAAGDGTISASIGKLGDTTVGTKSLSQGFSIRRFVFPSTSRLRVGSTRYTSGKGFPGSVHFLAFYNKSLSVPEIQGLLTSKLPNSLPSSRNSVFILEEDVAATFDLVSLDAAHDFDAGNVVAYVTILSVPINGRLSLANVSVTAGQRIPGNSVLKFEPAPEVFSVAKDAVNADCTAQSAYASFNFTASDGVCTDTNSDLSIPSCNSPVPATFSLCVREANDAPIVIPPPPGVFTVFADAFNPQAFSVKCKDIDIDPTFRLASVNITSQSAASLGSIYVIPSTNGSCGEGATAFTIGTTPPLAVASVPAPNTEYEWKFCYKANATALTTVHVGFDNITYQCIDSGGKATQGSLTVEVTNALIPGCGRTTDSALNWTTGIPCVAQGAEDEPMLITLNGRDAVVSHLSQHRFYRIDRLPTSGELFLLNGTAVFQGMIISADVGTSANVSSIAGMNATVANVTDGNLTLVYRPALDYFNAICCLNRNPSPITKQSRQATCPAACASAVRYTDALEKGFNGCTSPQGCPMTFGYSLGYDDGAGPSFGPSYDSIFRMTILGVNDEAKLEYLTVPTNVTFPKLTTDYFVAGDTPSLRYVDQDGDTYRVGFRLVIEETSAGTSFSVPNYSSPTSSDGIKRISLDELTDNCINTGSTSGNTACNVQGMAYQTDLNVLLTQLRARTNNNLGNGTIRVFVYDPVSAPENLDPYASFSIQENNITKNIPLYFTVGNNPDDSLANLGAAIWAGIAAALFFVLMSCCACWGCIFRRAKKGEEAAVWMVRNVLCTDVETRKHPDLGKMAAGGRRSLEIAIHAEHTRLVRVVCCALFMKRLCPCLVKFDTTDLRVPDEESMLQEAVNQTKKRIASIHRPKNGPDDDAAMTKAAKDPDVEDVVAEDVLADDSIFDWERHKDDKTGRVFYYNVKTHESSWKPPTVKVHEQHKIADRVSVKLEGPFQPKPPDAPKQTGQDAAVDDAEANRVKPSS